MLSRLIVSRGPRMNPSRIPRRTTTFGAFPSTNTLRDMSERTRPGRKDEPLEYRVLGKSTFIRVSDRTMLNTSHIAVISLEGNSIRFQPDSTVGYTAKTCEYVRKYDSPEEAMKDYNSLAYAFVKPNQTNED